MPNAGDRKRFIRLEREEPGGDGEEEKRLEERGVLSNLTAGVLWVLAPSLCCEGSGRASSN